MYTFIANPNARSGRGILLWKQIEKILLEKEIAYNVLFTKYQHHATRLVHDLTSDGHPQCSETDSFSFALHCHECRCTGL